MNDTTFCVDVLADFLYPNLIETEDFTEHIEHCEKTIKGLTRKAVEQNFDRFDDELKEQVPASWKVADRKQRTVITLVGEITYRRRVYEDTYGNIRYLLDEVLGITPFTRCDPAAFLWIVKCASDISFQKTADAFFNKTGVPISKQTVMRYVHKEGDLLAKWEDDCDLPLSTPVLFTEFDGFWVHLQSETKCCPALPRHTYKEQFKKKSSEMKVWVAYAGKNGNRRIHPMHWASASEPSEFFDECIEKTSSAFVLDDLEFLVTNSDAAGWCKNHGLDLLVDANTNVISKLDTYHINQKLYRAFSAEEDRKEYLSLLYTKNYSEFLNTLERRIETEPDDERVQKRLELKSYIEENLSWLENGSLSKFIRYRLIDAAEQLFAERPFVAHLLGLLEKRRYKRFVADLAKVVSACTEQYRSIYQRFYEIVTDCIGLIKGFGRMTTGTMEGTNSKVYAARLKVWGCAWSERGALAMMRIRATLASGGKLIAPTYSSWLTDKEKKKIEDSRVFSHKIPETVGKGYEPKRGSIPFTTHMPPNLYGMAYGS